MIRNTAGLETQRLAFGKHQMKVWLCNLKRNVQIKIMLLLELEWHARRLEKRQTGAIIELVKGVQDTGIATSLGLPDLEGLNQRQAEKVFVELSGLLGVLAAVGVVMEFSDHDGFQVWSSNT